MNIRDEVFRLLHSCQGDYGTCVCVSKIVLWKENDHWSNDFTAIFVLTVISCFKIERPEDGNIMEYSVLGHYNPSIQATADSGVNEQQLLCKYFIYIILTLFLSSEGGKMNSITSKCDLYVPRFGRLEKARNLFVLWHSLLESWCAIWRPISR